MHLHDISISSWCPLTVWRLAIRQYISCHFNFTIPDTLIMKKKHVVLWLHDGEGNIDVWGNFHEIPEGSFLNSEWRDELNLPYAKRVALFNFADDLIPQRHDLLYLNHKRKDGSSTQQRKGHICLRHPLLSYSSCMVEDNSGASRRSNLQAREEGRNSVSNWCCPKRFSRHCASQSRYWYDHITICIKIACWIISWRVSHR